MTVTRDPARKKEQWSRRLLAGFWSRILDASPRSLALGSLMLITGAMTAAAAILNNGAIVYVLDDAYIHLAIARNLIEHGTYGIEPGVFAAASSSPGWTLLLAGIGWIAPIALEPAPLVLGLTSAGVVVAVLACPAHGRIFEQCGAVAQMFWLALPVLLFLPPLILSGMEHPLHAALTLLLGAQWLQVIAVLTSGARPGRRMIASMAVLATAATIIRYETALLVAGFLIGLFVAAWSRWSELLAILRRIAVSVAALTLPTAAVIGFIGSLHMIFGQHPLPNPLLLKTGLAGGDRFRALLPNIWLAAWNFRYDAMIGGLLTAFLWMLLWSVSRRWRFATAIASGWLVAAALHAGYASFMVFGRYQAYLVVLGAFFLLNVVARAQLRLTWLNGAGALMAAMLVFAVSERAPDTLYTPLASNNIYEQQVQMARFMNTEYPGIPVAVNDLGVMAYRHDGAVLDLMGLATGEVLRARREGRFTRAFISDIADRRGVQVAIIYDHWIKAPDSWIKVAEWRSLRRQITPAGDTVAFYATSVPAAERLASRMSHFERTLPTTVVVRFFQPAIKAVAVREFGAE